MSSATLSLSQRYDMANAAADRGDWAQALDILTQLERDLGPDTTDEQRSIVAQAIAQSRRELAGGPPLWPWVLGGSVLLAGLGYWLYRRMR